MAATHSINFINITTDSVTAEFSIEGGTAGREYRLEIKYYPEANTRMAETISFNGRFASPTASVQINLPNLYSNKTYTVVSSLYVDGEFCNTRIRDFATHGVLLSFSVTAKSSSVISVAIDDMPALSYDVKIKFLYKRKNYSEDFINAGATTVKSGTSGIIPWVISGLMQDTEYTIKAQLYKVSDGEETLIDDSYVIEESTIAYTPGAEDTVPSFGKVTVVPHAKKAYIQCRVSKPLHSSLKVHLYETRAGGTWTDAQTLGSSLGVAVSTDVYGTRYYKLAVVDANGGVHNMTEPISVRFANTQWTDKTSGQPFSVSADEVCGLIEALIKMYEYKEARGDTIPSAVKTEYNNLRRRISYIRSGFPIYGRSTSNLFSPLYDISVFAMDLGNVSSFPDWHYIEATNKGEPAYADAFNAMADITHQALENL